MKQLILILATVFAFAANSQAQAVRVTSTPTTYTLTNADTGLLVFAQVGSNVRGVQVTITRTSGTIGGGTAVLQGSIDGISWDNLNDTLTLSNTATQSRTWRITATHYASYRLRVITSGTQVSVARGTLLRRPDERY